MTRDRIRRLAALFAIAVAAIAVYLHQLAVVQHDDWLTRSYMNRWAFRDVPTRRGAIFDATGRMLAEDVPGHDLEIVYRDARRSHPVGAVLHATELLRRALADPGEPLPTTPGWRADGTEHEAAFGQLLGLPLAWLGGAEVRWAGAAALGRYRDRPAEIGRDLRFYVGSAVAGLLRIPHTEVAAALRRALADPGERLAIDALLPSVVRHAGLAPDAGRAAAAAELVARFRARLAALHELDQRLSLERDPDAPGLFDHLDEQLLRWRDWADTLAADAETHRALVQPDFWRWLDQAGVDWRSWDDWRRFWAIPADDRSAPFDRRRLLAGYAAARAARRDQLTARRAELVDELRRLGRSFDPRDPERPLSFRVAAREMLQVVGALEDGGLWQPALGSDELAARLGGTREARARVAVAFEQRLARDREVPRFFDERRPRPAQRRLSTDIALWLGILQEDHPGFAVRASVSRRYGALPGRDGLGSLERIVGAVSSYRREDYAPESRVATPANEAATVRASIEFEAGGFDLPDGGLPPALEAEMLASAEQRLTGHFEVHGRIGRSGVEAAEDRLLRGRPGVRWIEQNRSAEEERMFENFRVEPGADLRLTIDLRVQRIVDDVLRANVPIGRGVGCAEAALVVLDPQSGDVLAMAGRRELVDDDGARRVDWSDAPVYPSSIPWVGSVAKPFVALEYLERLDRDRALAPLESFSPCPPKSVDYRETHHSCNSSVGHGVGARDVVDSLAWSCNWCFYEMAHAARERDGEWHTLTRGAFGRVGWCHVEDPTALLVDGFQRDVRGLARRMPSRVRFAPPGPNNVGPYVVAIGYEVDVPPLMVARAYAGLATGRLPSVGLIAGRDARAIDLGAAPRNLDLVRAGLRGVIGDRSRGTGREIAPRLERLGLDRVAHGKSGTAIVARQGGVLRENYWFALFLGTDADASLVVVAALYDMTGGSGGGDAAPRCADVVERLAADPELRRRWLDPALGGGH